MPKLSDVIQASKTTAWPGRGLCAKYVRLVFKNAGVGNFYGNAEDMYKAYCKYDTSKLQPGMILACDDSPTSTYGHVGIYIGNNVVRESLSSGKNDAKLSNWIAYNSKKSPVKCGWLGNVVITNDSEKVLDVSTLPTLYYGVKNKKSSVKALQSLLVGYGYSLAIDGSFGSDTNNKLKLYQKAQGLEVDGYCGPATWGRLLGVS